MIDTRFIRSCFPAFTAPSLKGFAHFENAGGSYACGSAIDALNRFYVETKLQPYYPSAPSSAAGEAMDQARQRMAAWLNVPADELHFGPSTTQNTYVLAQAFGKLLQAGDEIIVTNQDHEANVGAWARLAGQGLVVREWQVDPATGVLSRDDLAALLNERTALVAFTHCSNIIGQIHPVREWVDRIHAAGALAIVDGVSYCPHGLPDLAELGADAYLFSLYKVYGPHLGVMHLSAELNARLPNQGHYFNARHATARFTPAGPDHAQIAAVNGVIDYFEALYAHHHPDRPAGEAQQAATLREAFQLHERALLKPLLDWLEGHPKVTLYGSAETRARAPTVSFTVRGRNPETIARELADLGIGIGHGHFYAYRLIEALGLPADEGVLRVSFVHYTTGEEVDRLIKALDRSMG